GAAPDCEARFEERCGNPRRRDCALPAAWTGRYPAGRGRLCERGGSRDTGACKFKSSGIGWDLDGEDGNVIPRVGIAGPDIDLMQNCFDAFLQGFVSVLFDDLLQSLDA